MSPALPREERDAIRALRQKYDRVLDGRATPETAEIALELADAMVEKVPALLDALDAAEAALAALRGRIEGLANEWEQGQAANREALHQGCIFPYDPPSPDRLRALAADEGERTGR